MDNRKLAKFATVWCNPGVLDRMAKSDENSAQLIECVNPEHLYLGSIHYLQAACVGKWEQAKQIMVNAWESGFGEMASAAAIKVNREAAAELADSDESWQASEALLRGQNG